MARFAPGSFVVGLLLGIAAGFAAALVAVSAPGEAPSAAAPAAAVPPQADDDDDAGPRRAADRPRRAAADPLADLTSGLPTVETVTGTGVFDGTVRDSRGRPLAGVVVRADPCLDDVPSEPWPEGPISAEDELRLDLRRTVARHRHRVARLREAVTGADGRYRIEGVAPGRYWLHASAEGWRLVAAGTSGSNDRIAPDATRDWIAARRLGFDADVSGAPAGEGVRIQYRAAPAADAYVQSHDWSDADRRVEVAAGAFRVRAAAGDHQEWTSAWTEVVVAEDAPPPRVALTLRESRGFVGTVTAARGLPPVPVRVGIAPFRDGAPPAPRETRVGERATWIRPGERFAFMDVAPGRWAVAVTAPGRHVLAEDVVDVGDGLTRRDFALPAGDPGTCVAVRVLDPDGQAVADVTFRAGNALEGRRSGGDVDAVPRGDGAWLVPHWEEGMPSNSTDSGSSDGAPADDGTPAAVRRRWVEAASPTFGTASADYAPGDREVVLRFDPAAFVDVEFDPPTGGTVAPADVVRRMSVEVRLVGTSDRSWSHDAPTGDADHDEPPGPVRLGPIPVGDVEVRVGVGGGWEGPVWLPAVRRTLVRGTNHLRLAAPPLFGLRVTADADARRLSLRYDGTNAVEPNEASDTAAVWRFLPAGRYTLGDWERGEMTLVIPGAAQVRFEPKAFDAWRVSNVEPGGAAERAGLREGDVIVAVNGRELAGRDQMQNVWSAAQLEARSKLTLVRGGARLELEIPKDAWESMSVDETTR